MSKIKLYLWDNPIKYFPMTLKKLIPSIVLGNVAGFVTVLPFVGLSASLISLCISISMSLVYYISICVVSYRESKLESN